MSEFIKQATPKLRSAKHWLERAEKDFATNSPIRGELDLLLAEAELKACKEVRRPSSWILQWTFARHLVAGLSALLIFGIGAIYWSTTFRQESSDSITSVVPMAIVAEAVASPVVQPAITVVPINSHKREVNSENKTVDKDDPMSQEEKQQLIRRASQSLRGQTK